MGKLCPPPLARLKSSKATSYDLLLLSPHTRARTLHTQTLPSRPAGRGARAFFAQGSSNVSLLCYAPALVLDRAQAGAPHAGHVAVTTTLAAIRFRHLVSTSNTSADKRAREGKRRIFKSGDPELMLDVEGLNGFAAMMATMKEMGTRRAILPRALMRLSAPRA